MDQRTTEQRDKYQHAFKCKRNKTREWCIEDSCKVISNSLLLSLHCFCRQLGSGCHFSFLIKFRTKSQFCKQIYFRKPTVHLPYSDISSDFPAILRSRNSDLKLSTFTCLSGLLHVLLHFFPTTFLQRGGCVWFPTDAMFGKTIISMTIWKRLNMPVSLTCSAVVENVERKLALSAFCGVLGS